MIADFSQKKQLGNISIHQNLRKGSISNFADNHLVIAQDLFHHQYPTKISSAT
jgi:hypothetical protein